MNNPINFLNGANVQDFIFTNIKNHKKCYFGGYIHFYTVLLYLIQI